MTTPDDVLEQLHDARDLVEFAMNKTKAELDMVRAKKGDPVWIAELEKKHVEQADAYRQADAEYREACRRMGRAVRPPGPRFPSR